MPRGTVPEALAGEVAEYLLTQVLSGIARFSSRRWLGPGAAHRLPVRRRRFPRVSFYGSPLQNLKGGFLAHRHPHPELAMVLQGRLYIGLDSQVHHATAGDWCVFPPHTPHGECCTGNAYRLLWFVPGESSLRLHITSYSRSASYRVTSQTHFRDPSGEQYRRLKALCALPPSSSGPFRSGLLSLVNWCTERLGEDMAAAPDSVHPRIARARRLLDEQPTAPPSVRELAQRVGLSPNYLSGLFRRQVGLTIRRYIEERRIAAACTLLRQSALPLKEIAYTLRFADPHHFSHLFRRIMGTSPSTYRGQAVEIQTPDR